MIFGAISWLAGAIGAAISASIGAAIGGAIAGGLYALANGQDILQGAVNGALIAGAAAFAATASAYLQNAIMSWAGEMLGGLRTCNAPHE